MRPPDRGTHAPRPEPRGLFRELEFLMEMRKHVSGGKKAKETGWAGLRKACAPHSGAHRDSRTTGTGWRAMRREGPSTLCFRTPTHLPGEGAGGGELEAETVRGCRPGGGKVAGPRGKRGSGDRTRPSKRQAGLLWGTCPYSQLTSNWASGKGLGVSLY